MRWLSRRTKKPGLGDPRPGFEFVVSRDGGIRTRDPLNPIQVRYRAALRPVRYFSDRRET